jgi:RND family efflux transporter MFP subunit
MKKSDSKTKILRFIWSSAPWLTVMLILAFIVIMGLQINKEKARLAEAKKAALKNEIPPVKVITLTLKPRRLVDKISLPAEVEPYQDLLVKAEVHGQVVKVLIEEGQTVKKGQTLIQLDDRDYRMHLARADAKYRQAQLDHDRFAALVKKKIAAVTKLDEAEAQLKDLTAQRSEAQLALSRTKIISPIRGRVNEIKAKQGDFVAVGDPVAQVLQFDQVKVTVGVPESDVAFVFDLNEADIIIDALNKRKVKGKKIFLSRQPSSLARLFDLELRVPNPDGHILPGMFARVELIKQIFNQALAVPLYAIITQGDNRFVYIEKNGHAERRNVEMGPLIDWQAQVTSGLRAGESVIIVGQRFLSDGQKIEVIKNVSDPGEILKQ